MKNLLKKIISRNYILNKYTRKLYVNFRRIIYNLKYYKNEVDNKLIVFESYNGRNIACSPKRVLELLSKDEKYKNYKLIVFLKNPSEHKNIYGENVVFVKYNTKIYYDTMSRAKYIFTNSRIPKYINIKNEQIYIQCWHGTPLKRLGADIIENGQNGNEKLSDTVTSYLHEGERVDYFVSPSKYASEKFISSFTLDRLNKESSILEIGYPRNDFLYNFLENEVQSIKEKYGIDREKKIILYAPTWRDNQYNHEEGYTHKLAFDIDKIKKMIGDEYQILLRCHYFISNSIVIDKYDDFIINVSEVDDINELYVVSDMLITDYSSVFFDYATLKRPILFFMYDKDIYENEIRGFYLDLCELPGEIVENEKELVENILNPNFDVDRHNTFIAKFCYLDDGKAGERLINKVIDNE